MDSLNHKSAINEVTWQDAFLLLLPEINNRLRDVVRARDAQGREEAIHCAVVLCMLAFVGLWRRRRASAATASSLVWYATLQLRRGREPVVCSNSWEPLSPYAQRRRGFKAEPLITYDTSEGEWIDALVVDRHASVADIVATRLDFRAWMGTLCKRTRSIATHLAKGFTTSEVATKFRVTRGRVSQIRGELRRSWQIFQHEDVVESAAL